MTPLYARLPRGPHRLEPGEVAENQRQRMHGAMVEAVASQGYEATSVKQVISLAGVSRRAFYEQFSNKEECFLSTLELLASRASQRIGAAYRSADGDLEARMRASLQTLAELIAANPKSAHTVLVDAPSAGAAGWTRLTKTLLDFERTLARSFMRTAGGSPLPDSIVRGIVGGLHRVVFTQVRQRRATDLPDLAEDMLQWTLAFNSPAAMRIHGGVNAVVATPSNKAARPASRRSAGATRNRRRTATRAPTEAERVRLLEGVLEMIALEGYGNLSPLRIVDRAGTSIDAFFGLFGDVEGCALVALANLSEEIRQTIRMSGDAQAGSWPLGVRSALHSLMRYFAEHPSHADTLAKGAFEIGPQAVDLSLELGIEVARTLTADAPHEARSALVTSGVAGAIWHTLYCHTASQQTDRLPAVADDLAFMVLAPFLGAEQAAQALTSEPIRRGFSPLPERSKRISGRQSRRAVL
jgi:AcrR family transcriptional regulator